MNLEIARSALKFYEGCDNANIIYLGKSQNTTFRVETQKDDVFLLRIHLGIDNSAESFTPHLVAWQEPSVIESELVWLDALGRDTKLVVPQPVRNQMGKWVTEISNPNFEKPIYCTFLSWISGHHIDTELTSEQSYQVGALVAQMHQHARHWIIPNNFIRPKHDDIQLKSSFLQLRALVTKGVISVVDYEIFQQATDAILQLIRDIERTPDVWGIIHADIHDENYILHEGEICLIDFGRCGFGFYLYDIGQALSYIHPQMRSYFLEGYQAYGSLPVNFQRIVEAFFVSSTIENFAFLSTNPQEHEGLSKAVSDVAINHFIPYLNGEAFLFDR